MSAEAAALAAAAEAAASEVLAHKQAQRRHRQLAREAAK